MFVYFIFVDFHLIHIVGNSHLTKLTSTTTSTTTTTGPSLHGWVLANAYETCATVCGSDCNAARLNLVSGFHELVNISKITGAFSCNATETTLISANEGAPYLGTTDNRCIAQGANAANCSHRIRESQARRICCCGSDNDCPLDVPTT